MALTTVRDGGSFATHLPCSRKRLLCATTVSLSIDNFAISAIRKEASSFFVNPNKRPTIV
jgi:hypothetical protein